MILANLRGMSIALVFQKISSSSRREIYNIHLLLRIHGIHFLYSRLVEVPLEVGIRINGLNSGNGISSKLHGLEIMLINLSKSKRELLKRFKAIDKSVNFSSPDIVDYLGASRVLVEHMSDIIDIIIEHEVFFVVDFQIMFIFYFSQFPLKGFLL